MFKRYIDDKASFVESFTSFCIGKGVEFGYRVDVDAGRVRLAHADWCEQLALWQSATYVATIRKRQIDEVRLLKYRGQIESWFADLPAENSYIKMAGALIDALARHKPIRYSGPMIEVCTEERIQEIYQGDVPEFVMMGKRSLLLSGAPDETLSFYYVYQRFIAHLMSLRSKEKRFDLKAVPMTQHFLQNMVATLQSGNFNGLSLYMLFKAFDLFAVDYPRS